MLISQSFLPFLVKGGGGRIILMSSVAARGGYPTLSVYGSSKACVELLAHTWAVRSWRSFGVPLDCLYRKSLAEKTSFAAIVSHLDPSPVTCGTEVSLPPNLLIST
jgi:hypothetical protein